MKRRDFMSGLVAAATLAGPALAQDYVGSVVSQLEQMGFRSIRKERTLLGRVRIIGIRGDGRREIIINPNNGEILRDLWNPSSGSKRTSEIISDNSGRGGSGSGGDDGGSDDDESGDDGGSDDDESGDDGEDSGGDNGGDSGGDDDGDGGSGGSGDSGGSDDDDDGDSGGGDDDDDSSGGGDDDDD